MKFPSNNTPGPGEDQAGRFSLKRAWRRLRTLLWTALTLVVLLAAILVGVGKLLLPYSERYKPRLEAVLSEQFNQPVRVESFTGEWKAFGPRISLQGVTLLSAQGSEDGFALDQAALDIKPLNALISGRPLYSFRVIGAHVTLTRSADGQFELSGLGMRQVKANDNDDSSSGLRSLARLGEVRLQDSSFSFIDETRAIKAHLVAINGRLQMDDDQVAVEVQASISSGSGAQILGDLAVSALATINDEQQLGQVSWHVETGELSAAEVARGLPQHSLSPQSGWLNAEVWGAWSPGSPLTMEGFVDIRDAALDDDGEPLLIDHLNTRVRWRSAARNQWRLDLAEVQFTEGGRDWMSPRISVERNIPGGLGVWVSADRIEAEFPLRLTQMIMRNFNASWPASAPRKGRGLVTDFDLLINEEKNLAAVSGRFDGIDVLDWGKWPLVSGLSGRVDLAFGEGSLWFAGEDVGLSWPRNFLSDTRLSVPECEMEILWERREFWQMDALNCALSNEWIELQARTRFVKDEGKPLADMNVHVSRIDLSKAGDFWPRSVMSPKVTGWLDRAIVAGEVTNGRLSVQGDMDDFPFAGDEGSLVAEFSTRGVHLAYQPGWPDARGLAADVRFDGPRLFMTGSIANLAGNPVQAATATIENIRLPLLNLSYSSNSNAGALGDFLRATPLLSSPDFTLDDYRFNGPLTVDGTLNIPFGATPGETTVAGQLTFNGVEFQHVESGFQLEALDGAVSYTRDGVAGEQLGGTFSGWPATLDLRAAWAAEERFWARLQGDFPASMLIAKSPLADEDWLRGIEGNSLWAGELSVLRPDELASSSDIWLTVNSDLLGTSIDLPAPLNKGSEEGWPLQLKLPIKAANAEVQVTLGQRLHLRMEAEEALGQPVRAALRLGSGVPELPAAGEFAVTGAVDRFDLDGWAELVIKRAALGLDEDALDFSGLSLQARSLILANRRFEEVGFTLEDLGTELNARFDSADLAGTVRYSRNADGSDSISAQMERFLMPDPETESKKIITDPSSLPELHFYFEAFRYAGIDLGETRIEAYPVANGLRFDSVQATSPEVTVEARGDWVSTEDSSRSDFDIVLTSESLGSLVNALEISAVLEGGQTMIHYDAWWPGAPTEFALARLNGDMTVSVVDGRVLNAEPGAGRMLGLMSVAALPRRLALDFSDVFQSGFGFDQASGTIQLSDGVAFTEDFVMESTAASLGIEGKSDLVAQTYDYTMTVRPGVSQALPVIGALTAGPVGAAAGLALQGLLRESLGDAAEARYSISGPWDEPQVDRLESTARAPGAAPPNEPDTSAPAVSPEQTDEPGADEQSSATALETTDE